MNFNIMGGKVAGKRRNDDPFSNFLGYFLLMLLTRFSLTGLAIFLLILECSRLPYTKLDHMTA